MASSHKVDTSRESNKKADDDSKHTEDDAAPPLGDFSVQGISSPTKRRPQRSTSIKLEEIIDKVTSYFWVVRIDGTGIDSSSHKCLKAKVSKEAPDLLEHYESLYMGFRKLDMELTQRQDGENPVS